LQVCGGLLRQAVACYRPREAWPSQLLGCMHHKRADKHASQHDDEHMQEGSIRVCTPVLEQGPGAA
jgi:hypothetical protein